MEHSDSARRVGCYAIGKTEKGDHGEEVEPEPEDDVDLFVDDIDGEDAHGVVFLYIARGPVSVEGAFG